MSGISGGPSSPLIGLTSISRTVVVSIPNAAYTTVAWDSEQFDELATHDNVTNPSRITAPNGTAKIILHAYAQFQSAGGTIYAVQFMKNGGVLSGPMQKDQTGEMVYGRSIIVAAVPGDYFEMQVFQNTGAANLLSVNSRFEAEFFR